MAGEWSDKPLLELCSYINRGSAPAYIEAGGVLVLNQKCVRDQRVSFLEARRTDQERKLVIADRMLQLLDILVNSTGVGTLGRVAQLVALPEPATVDSHVTIVRPDPAAVDPRYLGFAVRLYEREIEALAEGSTGQTELSRARLGAFPVPLAPEKEQRAIAHILGTLDDKIELNRKMNETLEAMARALFKNWFVDFLPVRAKAESHDTGLPKEIADLFPDAFVDSELGDIPKGWHTNTLGNILELAYGKALKEAIRRPGSIPVFGSNGQVGWHDEKLTEGPGIVVGRKGNPGIITWVHTDFFPIDTTFYVVPKSECRSLYFLFYALQAQDVASLGADSSVLGLNRNLAYMNKQVIPPPDVLNAFDKQVKPLFERIFQNTEESRILAALRDTLLPKLISGALRVPDAERFIEEAGG